MIRRIGPVTGAAGIGDVAANVYRSDRIPAASTEAITVLLGEPRPAGHPAGPPRERRLPDHRDRPLPRGGPGRGRG